MKITVTLASIGLAVCLASGPAWAQTQKRQAPSQQVAIDQLPEPVTSAVQKTYPGGKIVTAYKMTRNTQVRYELWVKPTPDAQALVVTATPDGQLAGAKGKQAKKAPLPAATKPGTTPSGSSGSSASQGDPIAVDQLPKAVAKAVKEAYPKDSIIQAFKTTAGAEVTYQVVLSDVASVQPMRVSVTADGRIVKR
jgi:hypothetical protein